MTIKAPRALLAVLAALLVSVPALADQAAEERNLNEIRNTVINLLQSLVQKGVLSADQAAALVKTAQDKAAADAAATASQELAEKDAIRVPYVPEIIKDEIKKEVSDQLAPEVAKEVVATAKAEKWGVPGALPDWLGRVRWSGDVRLRAESDIYPSGNVQDAYLNFNAVNAAGGIARAGDAALLNTSIDRRFMAVRLRLNMDAALNSGWSVGARLSTGTLTNPDSLNQQLGQYGGRYTTDIDLAYLHWLSGNDKSRQQFGFWGGRFANPFLYSDLVWMPDVTFEGVAADYRVQLWGDTATPHRWFITLGALPEQNVTLTNDFGPASNNKWLLAGQTGFDLQSASGSRFRFGAAYYDFSHLAGQKNALNSDLLDYTAPVYLQKGNTLFDILNTADTTRNLFALAADFRELDFMVAADWAVAPGYRLSGFADYVKNVGYNSAAVAARVGSVVPPRVKGYEGQLSFGTSKLDHPGAWDASLGYRYVQRDAVVDAFTDQDYHLGGTDNTGYYLGGDASFTDRVWTRLRYMPFKAIDGPPLTIDVWQLELNARF